MVDTRLVVDTLKIGNRAQFHEILVASVIHSQQNEVKTGFVFGRVSVMNGASRDICFDADDRFYVLRFTRLIKLDRTRQRTVIRHGYSVHTELFDARH